MYSSLTNIPLYSVKYEEKKTGEIHIHVHIPNYELIPHSKSRWRTHHNRYISMMNHIITDAAQDGSPDRAQTPTAHDNHVSVELNGGVNDPLPRALRLGASHCARGLRLKKKFLWKTNDKIV